jgi:hypothetical protein
MFRASLILAVLAAGATANAQPLRDAHELSQDRREIGRDRAQRRDDLRDLKALEELAAEMDAARARNDHSALVAVDHKLRARVAGELAESQAEMRQDMQEVRRDRREARSERHEMERDVAHGRPVVAADDRRDLKDDRRDTRGDMRKAALERANLGHLHQVASELEQLLGRTDPPSLDRKRRLLGELISLARAELAQDRREVREDHRELREDRHEAREALPPGR